MHTHTCMHVCPLSTFYRCNYFLEKVTYNTLPDVFREAKSSIIPPGHIIVCKREWIFAMLLFCFVIF